MSEFIITYRRNEVEVGSVTILAYNHACARRAAEINGLEVLKVTDPEGVTH